MTFSYDELFGRNLGVFTAQEQARTKSLTVAIAGAGGLGGPVAYNLARLGVGGLRLADPEVFEPSNINRQYGAYVDTVGRNKAEAIADELRRINPRMTVTTWASGIDESNVAPFLDGASLVIDGIDFFELEAELLLHREAARRGLWIFTHQGALEMLTGTIFAPGTRALERMVLRDGSIDPVKAIRSFFPLLPRGLQLEDVLAELTIGELAHIPSHATSPSIGGALCVEDVIRQAVRLQPPRVVAPQVYAFSLETFEYRIVDGV
jgi:molybdopterin/thiamine biosynthesis adenylyltransferase